MAVHKSHIKPSTSDRVFNIINHTLIIIIVIIMFYPLWYILCASMSDGKYAQNGSVLLFPVGWNFLGYKECFRTGKIWMGYLNTIIYTVCGTALGVFCSILAGYSLSRKDLPGGSIIMKLFVFTMYFGGGTIPYYIIIKNLGLLNTRLMMILQGTITVYNIILIRSYFVQSLPPDLKEAADIDGCNNTKFLFQIAIPLSKAIIAVVTLYLAVSYWNSYFWAMIFLRDESKAPLQIILRQILLISSNASGDQNMDPQALAALNKMRETLKYAVIIVATIPIIAMYPFIQKYFVQGVMIGSIKG